MPIRYRSDSLLVQRRPQLQGVTYDIILNNHADNTICFGIIITMNRILLPVAAEVIPGISGG